MKPEYNENFLRILANDKAVFLNYFKSVFPVFHNSNIFFRDFQNAIRKFIQMKGNQVTYAEAEALANKFASELEKDGTLTKVNFIGWRLNYPLFKTGAPQTYEVTEAVNPA